MKTKHLLIPAVAGAFFFASCSNKPSEETMKAISDFETAWTELGNQATAWADDLKKCTDDCAAHCAKHEGMDMSKMTADMKTKAEEGMAACKHDKEVCEGMWHEWETFKTEWDTMSAQFGAWKAKAGESSDEDAKKALDEWTTKKNDAETKVNNWKTALDAAKAECGKHTTACDEMEKAMMEAANNDDKNKKKG
jgi:hypothetical protein